MAIVGFEVRACVGGKKYKDGRPKFEKVSQQFTARSAAEDFRVLYLKSFPDSEAYVHSIDRLDSIDKDIIQKSVTP